MRKRIFRRKKRKPKEEWIDARKVNPPTDGFYTVEIAAIGEESTGIAICEWRSGHWQLKNKNFSVEHWLYGKEK